MFFVRNNYSLLTHPQEIVVFAGPNECSSEGESGYIPIVWFLGRFESGMRSDTNTVVLLLQAFVSLFLEGDIHMTLSEEW